MIRLVFAVIALLFSGLNSAQEKPVVVAVVAGSADVAAGRAVIEEAYRRIGVPVEFRSYPASEALAMSNGGEVDAELQRIDGTSNSYPNLVKIPIPINIIQGAVFSRDLRFPIMGWHSLRPYRIGIVRGILFAEQQTIGMERTFMDSYPALIDAINNGEVDVGVMLRIGGLSAIRELKSDGIVELDGVLETLFLYHYVHRSRADLVEKLQPVLKDMLLSGEIRRMREQAIAALKEES